MPASLAGRVVRCPRCSLRFPAVATRQAEPAPTEPEDGAIAPTVADDGALAPTRLASEGPATSTGVSWRPGDIVLGLYEVRDVLGEGGMGRVYRVRHLGWGLDLAVKVPLAAALEAAGGVDFFEREAEAWVGLGLHPHVVTCHYVRRDAGLPLVFADLVDGGSLHEAVRARRMGSAEEVLDVAIQFAWGLHHAHEQGLVHRDVKPANVLLTTEGIARVTDFGLARARVARVALPAGAASGHTLTVEGGGGGTPAYCSPEQAAGRAQTRRSDLWGFALSVLEAFLGGRTWEYGLVAAEVLEEYRRGGLAVAGRPPMPGPVADLLSQCFRERPDDRPHDLSEVAAALRKAWETVAGRSYPREEPRGGLASADALNNRAVSLVDLGRARDAEALWQKALESDAQHLESTYNAGLVAWRAGRAADAEFLRRLEAVGRAHGGRARAHQMLGRVLLALERAPEALLAFERAQALGGTEDLGQDLEAARSEPAATLHTLRGLPSAVAALALTPDGRTVAAGGGPELRVWDAGTGRLLRTLPVPDGPVRSVLVAADGRFLLAGAEGAPLTQWDLATGRPIRSWARHSGYTTGLALAGGARLVVAGGSDRVVRLWDGETGRLVREMAGHEDAVSSVAGGLTCVASASRDGTVRIWSLGDGSPLATLRGHDGRVLAVALDEGRGRVVTAGEDGTVREWDLRSRSPVHAWRAHGQAATCVAIHPGGSRLLSGSADRTVRGFEAGGGPLVALARLDASVTALAVAGDGTTWAAHGAAVSALDAGRLRLPPAALCRPASASELEERASVFGAEIAKARRSLVEGDVATALSLARQARSVPGHERSEAALAVWDGLVARLPRRALLAAWESGALEGHRDQALAVSVDAEGMRALSAGLDGTVRLWDLATRRAEAELRGHEGAVTSVAFAGASRAVSGGRDRTVRLWTLSSGSFALLEGHEDAVAAVDATPDGSRAASGSWDGTARVFDLRRRTVARVLAGHRSPVSSVRLSPDGQVLLSGGWDGTARLWDASTGAALAVLGGHDGNVTAVALHSAGRLVATGAQDGVVRLFEARTRRQERRLEGHQAEVSGLAFTPDGRFLLTASRDRSVRVFDLRSGAATRTLAHASLVLALGLAPAASVLVTAGGDGLLRLWHLDWEPDSEPADASNAPRASASPQPAAEPTLREELRRAAPLRVPAFPGAARRVPWRRAALGVALAAATGIAWLAWREPAARVRLSPTMREGVAKELDLVDLAPFTGGCSPGDYERHMEALRTGNPDARDVACVAARGDAGVVADVMEGVPHASDDPLTARRFRRHAASALAGLREEAVETLCAYLGDERPGVRLVAADALSVLEHEAAAACVGDALRSAAPPAPGAAARALRQRLARGLFGVEEGWTLVVRLAEDPDPERRLAALALLPLFAADVAEPVTRPLLDDPEPDVVAAARRAIDAIGRTRSADERRE